MNQVDPTWNEVDQAGQDRPDHLNILCGLLVGNVSTPQCGGASRRDGSAGRRDSVLADVNVLNRVLYRASPGSGAPIRGQGIEEASVCHWQAVP